MLGIDLDLSGLETESIQQIADFKDAIKQLCVDNPDLEPSVTSYMEQIEKGFEELKFKEPARIPDVFLKGFNERT